MRQNRTVEITRESVADLSERIYKSCLKASDTTQESTLAEALDIIYKEIHRAHAACGKREFVLQRMKNVLPTMIEKADSFEFPGSLRAFVTEVIESVFPDYQPPEEYR